MDFEEVMYLIDYFAAAVSLICILTCEVESFAFIAAPIVSAAILIPQLLNRDISLRWILFELFLLFFAWFAAAAFKIRRELRSADTEEDDRDQESTGGLQHSVRRFFRGLLHREGDDQEPEEGNPPEISGEERIYQQSEEALLRAGRVQVLHVIFDGRGRSYAVLSVAAGGDGDVAAEKYSVVRFERKGASDYVFRAADYRFSTDVLNRYNTVYPQTEIEKRRLKEKLEDPDYLREHLAADIG